MNKKKGIGTKEEIEFFVKKAVDAFNFGWIISRILKGVAPTFINKLDDKYGDMIPPPWQEYAETLVTKVYISLQDNKISEKERQDISNYCGAVISSKVTLPDVSKSHNTMVFVSLVRACAAKIDELVNKL